MRTLVLNDISYFILSIWTELTTLKNLAAWRAQTNDVSRDCIQLFSSKLLQGLPESRNRFKPTKSSSGLGNLTKQALKSHSWLAPDLRKVRQRFKHTFNEEKQALELSWEGVFRVAICLTSDHQRVSEVHVHGFGVIMQESTTFDAIERKARARIYNLHRQPHLSSDAIVADLVHFFSEQKDACAKAHLALDSSGRCILLPWAW